MVCQGKRPITFLHFPSAINSTPTAATITKARRDGLTTGFPFSLHGGRAGRASDDQIEQADPQQKLDQWSLLDEDVVRCDRLGDALEGVQFTGNADKVGRDEPQHGQHSRTPVTQFRLAEPRQEGLVRFRQFQLSR